MRAVVHDRYGPPDVLRIEEVERPVPDDDQVLVRIHASTVNAVGLRLSERRDLHLPLLHRPSPAQAEDPGHRVRRGVEAVGGGVTEFEVGDRVFGVKGDGRPC